MLYAVGAQIPEYRVRAFNNASDSTNLIHADEHARRYGYRGGLVPGVSIFAYMSRSLVDFLGRAWLERGSADVRFLHPIYDGEEVRVSGSLAAVGKDGTLRIECQALNALGVTCARGTAELPPEAPCPEPARSDYPAGRSGTRRTIALETLEIGELLEPISEHFDWKGHWEYCQKEIRDHHPLYGHLAHPGWLLTRASRILATNYDLPPWMHVGSMVQHYCALENEGTTETRGRVIDRFERKGHHFIVLDVALFGDAGCLATVRHTAIFSIAPRAA